MTKELKVAVGRVQWVFAATALMGLTAGAAGDDMHVLEVDGERWLATVTAPHDADAREETYKVYTHLYDFEGEDFLTKGVGGRYTHHRGLFIGWNDTLVEGTDYDSWHMSNCYQEHVAWLYRSTGPDGGVQSQVIEWRNLEDEPFIREVRNIVARKGKGGLRIVDFSSELVALKGDIDLRGDLQHAGMQIRMSNEVTGHEQTTEYTLPEGAHENENDEVIGAWWMLGSFEIDGRRVWVAHMTAPDHPAGTPVYSIRRYGRFGAFWEQTIREKVPAEFDFRIVVSEEALDGAAVQTLYEAYGAEREAEVAAGAVD